MNQLYLLYRELNAEHNQPMLDEHVGQIYDDLDIEVILCRCGRWVPKQTAHFYEPLNAWLGDVCCWDERLRSHDPVQELLNHAIAETGWNESSINQLFKEFIKEEGLIPEFAEFIEAKVAAETDEAIPEEALEEEEDPIEDDGTNESELYFKTPKCPTCGEYASGVLESVLGIAELRHNKDGGFTYAGETDVDWDTQESYATRKGFYSLRCPNRDAWESEVIERET
jgi:hypothetical protein